MTTINFIDERETKFNGKKFRFPATIKEDSKYYYIKSAFEFKDALKIMQGSRWMGKDEDTPMKFWRVNKCRRNDFWISYLEGTDTFARYNSKLDETISKIIFQRPVYDHQKLQIAHILQRKQCIISGEMGTGKTLAAIEAMERSGINDWWFVGTKSAIVSVRLEFWNWNSFIKPNFMTYDELKKTIELWPAGKMPPQGIIFDESSKLKTPSSQRSQAAFHVAEAMRTNYGDDAYIVLMSGSPAPKSPVDWYWQCFSKDTWILTENGPRKINDIAICNIYNDNKLIETNTGTLKRGIKEVWEIVTKEGFKIKTTKDHKFSCNFNGISLWKELQEIQVGNSININNHTNCQWHGHGTFNDGYLLGHLIGDGFISKKQGMKTGFSYEISLWEKDYDLLPILLKMFDSEVIFNKQIDGRIDINTIKLRELCEEFNLKPDKQISETMESASSDFISGLLSGLFDIDGCVEKKRLRIRLTQVNKQRLEIVQRLLMYFGIMSKIVLQNKAKIHIIEGRNVNCQDCYVLIISGNHCKTFYKQIGFKLAYKQELLESNLSIKSQMSQNYTATVSEINCIGVEEVFDISVPETNQLSANGFVAHNCEMACPGFLREGDVNKFKDQLAVTEYVGDITGTRFPKFIAWRDGAQPICNECGKAVNHDNHIVVEDTQNYHKYQPLKDEVSRLYRRMNGLVLVQFKKDCLDLPDKIYKEIHVKPNLETMRAAQLIQVSTRNTMEALTKLRELSDGFQYIDEWTDKQTCTACKGNKELFDNDGNKQQCPECEGKGEVRKQIRKTKSVHSPKYDALTDLLNEDFEDENRIVIYGAFTGTIDRICEHIDKLGWQVMRVDGRGWCPQGTGIFLPKDSLEFMKVYQNPKTYDQKIAFVAHPGSAGMGLTLTASKAIIYFSNDFNGESRIQSEDRVHRIGMDLNKGATIYDMLHLPTDAYVLKNLKRKRELQSLSMGLILEEMKAAQEEVNKIHATGGFNAYRN